MLQFVQNMFRRSDAGPARRLYTAAVDQARQPAFYAEHGVADTATGRFDMIALHVFLIAHRLESVPEGEEPARLLCEAAIDDLDRNLREMGIGDLSVGKKVKRLAQGLYGRMEAYAAAVEAERPEAAMEAALKRNLFASDQPPAAGLQAMARYALREVQALRTQPVEAILRGEVRFGAVPTVEAA